MEILITDDKTNLCSALLEQYHIAQIAEGKSRYGQILYTLDKAVGSGLKVLYLSDHESFARISEISERICNMHADGEILVLDIDSASIGKNNLCLRLAQSENPIATAKSFGTNFTILSNGEPSVASGTGRYCFGHF